MGDVWHSEVKSLSVCFLDERNPEMSQFIQSHCCQFYCRCHVSWSHILTVLRATLHAKESKMTCTAESLQHFHWSLVISKGKSWGIVWDLFIVLVTVHMKTHFWAFLRTLESISDLFVQVWFTGSLHDDLTRLEAFPVVFSAVLYKHFNEKCPGKILWHISFPVSRAFPCI